jgi:hypothetical protein
MPVSLQLVMKLQKLRHLTHAEAAERLALPVAAIEEASRMGAVTMRDEDVEQTQSESSPNERAALRDRIPKKWREHYGDGDG